LRILKVDQLPVGTSQQSGFTHHDPLEDTERELHLLPEIRAAWLVSPITIRLRILKVLDDYGVGLMRLCFTHHDPLEDTESVLAIIFHHYLPRFTHHDPLEDTESTMARRKRRTRRGRFTHHDPLEDTERDTPYEVSDQFDEFHPSRSA